MRWDYKTKDGNVVGHVIRLNKDNQSGDSKPRKDIIPYFKAGGKAGIPKDLPPEYRLYGMDCIQSMKRAIFIVEGEKCAHALQTLGYQAITSLGGCAQVHLADWQALKDAELIYLCPDNDDAGQGYIEAVYKALKGFNGSFKQVRFSNALKGDVCDFLSEMSELKSWDGFSSLERHSLKNILKSKIEDFLKNNATAYPVESDFITTKHRHKIIPLSKFQALKLPKRKMLLSPWLPEGSITMIFADRGIGKTFFALSCAVALASGQEFISYKAENPVPVLYLDGEMQATSMQSRLKMLTEHTKRKDLLWLYTPDCQDNEETPDIGTPEGREHINEIIEECGARVVFVDNLSTFDRTGKENEAESWSPIQEWAIQHRKKGRAIVFIHHANKEGKQRGSHKKEDVMDAVIKLKRPDDYIADDVSTKILVQYTKHRHMSGADVQDIEAEIINHDDFIEWTYKQGDVMYQKIVQMVKDKVPLRDIAESLSIGKSTVHRLKNKAISEGLL